MKHLSILSLFTFHFALFTLSASAAVPLKWTVETSRATPATFEAYQGETLALEAALQSYGKPLEAPSNYSLYWQTNGMGSTYWSVPVRVPSSSTGTGTSNSNLMYATWSPTNDVGAKVYNCFIGQPGTIYHASFQLRLRPSPGATPNELPLPQKVIDFAKVTVINPPWSGGGGGGVDTNAVREIAQEEISLATNGIPEQIDGHIPPAISNATGRIDADLTVTKTVTYDNWTPEGSPLSGNPITFYTNVYWFGTYWCCARYEDDSVGGWIITYDIPMTGSQYSNLDATELTFPDGTKTYKKRTVEYTLALTSQLAAKQDALSAAQLVNIEAVPSKLNANDPVLTATDPSDTASATSLAGAKATGEALAKKADEGDAWTFSGSGDVSGLALTYNSDYWSLSKNGTSIGGQFGDEDAKLLVFIAGDTWSGDFDLTATFTPRVLRTGYIPSAISNDTTRIDADLTVKKVETYDDWTPNESTITGVRYYNIYLSPAWGSEGGWAVKFGEGQETLMGGDIYNIDATELTFPDGTKTYRKRTVTTKLATTNDVNGAISEAISTNNPAFVSAVRSVSPAPSANLRVFDAVRQCWWIGTMVNGVINWEVE